MVPGALNALTDVPGLRVGHAAVPGGRAERHDGRAGPARRARWAGWTCAARPPAPGRPTCSTRATPSSGCTRSCSAAAARTGWPPPTACMARLEAAGIGFPVPGGVVPIVPAAVLFDLGRGGDFGARPDAATGAAAVRRRHAGPVAQGVVGAGTGARGRRAQGGRRHGQRGAGQRGSGGRAGRGERGGLCRRPAHRAAARRPARAARRVPAGRGDPGRARRAAGGGASRGRRPPARPPRSGVVATDLTLDKAGCARLAAMGHDGLARAIVPGAHGDGRRHGLRAVHRRPPGPRAGRAGRAAGGRGRRRQPGRRARRARRPHGAPRPPPWPATATWPPRPRRRGASVRTPFDLG